MLLLITEHEDVQPPEVDIIKKTENQAKMTKLSMEWKRLCKIKAKDTSKLAPPLVNIRPGKYLMYLTASRPDIMFAVCLWYPRDSPFELEAFSNSDYGGASLDRKSTTSGCQFLGRRLISWQCKKQTIVSNSTTKAEYVAAANCCGQVLWIQNQMMDYGFNFMNTRIHIDNERTISVIKNSVAHSRTKHIEIRFHFIRDCYEKRLIEVIKIHTDSNVADLLTKGFDVTRFNFLVETAILSTTREGLQAIYVTIDGHEKLITEDSLRRHLKLDDVEGISSLSNEEIFEHLAHMGIDGLEKDLQQTKKTYSTALTKLVLRVKKLEYKLKSGKARRMAKIVLSDDEEILEDSSKQGRKIS
ncbi:hypothetical protein Tco_0385688 [Tanacetum coccineum]